MRLTTRHLVLAGAGLVAASTAATSFVSLLQLAQLCGIPGPLAAALPIALDAGAGVAALVWITEQGERRAWGRGVAVGALIATLVGNGVQHAITSGLMERTLPLVLAVGACIPAMLFCVIHLAALITRQPVATKVERTERPVTKRSRTARPVQVEPQVTPAPVEESQHEQRAGKPTPRSWTVANWPVTAREIQIATGVTKGYAHKLRERVKAEVVAS